MLRSIQRILLLVFLSCLFITPGFLKAQKEPEKNYIKVRGTGTVSKEPDIAYANLDVTTLEKTAKEAYEANVKKSNELIEAAKKIGLSPEDFKNNVRLSQSRDEHGKRIGFSVTNSIKVSLADLDLVAKLIDLSSDYVTESKIKFGLTDKEKANLEALDLAFSNAKSKAVILAGKAGLKLGEVISIDEFPVYESSVEIVRGGFDSEFQPEQTLVLNPQKVNITSNIVVIFEVRSK